MLNGYFSLGCQSPKIPRINSALICRQQMQWVLYRVEMYIIYMSHVGRGVGGGGGGGGGEGGGGVEPVLGSKGPHLNHKKLLHFKKCCSVIVAWLQVSN